MDWMYRQVVQNGKDAVLRAASAHGRCSTGARDKIQIGLDNDREKAYT